MNNFLSGNNRKTYRCWSAKNSCDWAHSLPCVQKYVHTSRRITTGSVLGCCGTEAVLNKILFLPLLLPSPPPFSLIRCLFVRCVFCELVFIIAVVYGEGSVNRTKHTLHIFPVLENACSGSVLVINVVNSSTVILLKCHTVGVVHVGVPKDYIYLILLCLSYVGNILSHHGILAQLKPILNIVTVHFNIILLCLVSGSKCSRNARSLLFGGISFHYRSRCQLSC